MLNESLEPRCPYCSVEIEPASAVRCARCDVPMHAECLAAAGDCAIYGCGTPVYSRPPTAPTPPVVTGKAGEWPGVDALVDRALAGELDGLNRSELAAVHVELDSRVRYLDGLEETHAHRFPAGFWVLPVALVFGVSTLVALSPWLPSASPIPSELMGQAVALAAFPAMIVLVPLARAVDRALCGSDYQRARRTVEERVAEMIEQRKHSSSPDEPKA